MRKCSILVSAFLVCICAGIAHAEWQAIQKEMGQTGRTKNGVLMLSYPRTDFNVQKGGIVFQPPFFKTSDINFMQAKGSTIVNGELALTESEVARVVSRLRAGGFKIAAVHNHLMAETPRVMFLHFSGQGNALAMARNIRGALTQTGTPLTVSPPTSPTVNWSTVTAVLGKPDQQQGTVAEFSFARRDRITMDGTAIPPEMGVRSEVEMQMAGTSVATTGEFILVASEIQPVVDTLQKYGITVEAIHNHTLTESPRTFYLHFWGVGSPASMSRGVRAALEKTNSVLPK